MNHSTPLVSIITPVYNGERYIAECIESVLAQTYKHWEYIIVNNRSTDRTPKIAEKYASKDSRISIQNSDRFFSIMRNHNHALRFISKKSKYTKFVHADDWLFPECVERMVHMAEEHPRVVLVSSYRLNGLNVDLCGLPYTTSVISGREICRRTLLGDDYVFGTPSSHLIRSEIIRRRDPFYDESLKNSDHDACYDILRDADLGFIHQVLTYTRAHEEQISSTGRRHNFLPEKLNLLKKYGPVYLNNGDYESTLKRNEKNYYRYLAKNLLKLKGREFWEYHTETLKEMGNKLDTAVLLKETFLEVCDLAFNPKKAIEKVIRRI